MRAVTYRADARLTPSSIAFDAARGNRAGYPKVNAGA